MEQSGGEEGEGADEEWQSIKDDELINQERLLEVKSKESHIVHCPYFPMVSLERKYSDNISTLLTFCSYAKGFIIS